MQRQPDIMGDDFAIWRAVDAKQAEIESSARAALDVDCRACGHAIASEEHEFLCEGADRFELGGEG